MSLVIVHGGQTGVDRGAHRGALAGALMVAGYMPNDARDEQGMIPFDVAEYLIRCPSSGLVARTHANITLSHAVLAVVADACEKRRPHLSPGTARTLREAKYRNLPHLVVDPSTPIDAVRAWIDEIYAARIDRDQMTTRLMVAGPRATRWPEGEAEAQRVIAALGGPRVGDPLARR